MGLLDYALSLKTGAFDRPLRASRGLLTNFGAGVLSTAGKLGKLGLALTAVAGPAAAVGIAFKSFNAAADLESTQVALRTLVGDVELADQTLSKVRRLAASTPFQFPELASSTRKLIAFEESAQTVPTTLRRIGDVAAGVQAPIEELAELYGKARVQGTLYAEDINQLMGRGIPILQEVAKILGVNSSEVKKLASEGKITFPLLEQSFINLTGEGGKFFEMMKTQSATTNGLLSTLKDSANEIFLVIGQPLNDAFKPILTGAIDRSKLFGIQLQGIISLFQEAGSQGKLGSLIGSSLQVGAIKFVNTISGGFRGSVAFLSQTLPQILKAGKDLFFDSSILQSFSLTFQGIGSALEAKILRGADALAKATGLGLVVDFGLDAEAAELESKFKFKKAENALKFGNDGDAFQNFTNSFSGAINDGVAAWKNATAEDLVSEGPALKKWEDLAKELNPDSAGRILNPSNFLPKDLNEAESNTAEGLKAAIDAATKTKEIEKTKAQQVTAALNRNTAALRPGLLSAPGQNPARPARGGAVFSTAESLARQFGRTKGSSKSFDQFIGDSLGGRGAVRDFAKSNNINLAEARNRLVALAQGANPGGGKKPPGVDPQVVAANRMLDVVKNIDDNLTNLAVA